jgi:hypothetical protein
MSQPTTTKQMFARILKLGALLTVAIAAVGGAAGFAIAGTNGLFSALVGSAMALAFTALTALSVQFGAKLPLGGFFGLVMGGWLLKLVAFIAAIAVLKSAGWVNGPILFFAIVASVLGNLAIDAIVVFKSKIPTYQS